MRNYSPDHSPIDRQGTHNRKLESNISARDFRRPGQIVGPTPLSLTAPRTRTAGVVAGN